MKKTISLILIAITLLIAFKPIDVNASSISDMQQQIKENNKKRQELEAQINEKKKEKNSTQNEITLLDLEAESLRAEVYGLQLEIDDLNNKIKENETAIQNLIVEIDENNTVLEKRLRASYKRGDVGYLEIILNSENIIDALTRLDMIQLIVKEDVNLLKDIEQQKTNVELLKKSQEEEKQQVVASKEKLDAKKKEVESKQYSKEKYMAELQNDMKEMQAMEERMEKENAKLEKDIAAKLLETAYTGGEMLWPLPNNCKRITSYFGKRIHPLYGYWTNHRGIDIACPYNTDVYAANDGVVIVAEWHWSYGNYVIIDHGGKIATVYGHNTKLLVGPGQTVKKGQVIALSGSTGESTGPHLHFEVRKNGVVVDPLPYVKP